MSLAARRARSSCPLSPSYSVSLWSAFRMREHATDRRQERDEGEARVRTNGEEDSRIKQKRRARRRGSRARMNERTDKRASERANEGRRVYTRASNTCTRTEARNPHTVGVTPRNEGEGCVKGFSRARRETHTRLRVAMREEVLGRHAM